MNLVEQRNEWRKHYEAGNKPDNNFLDEYRKKRDSDLWRCARQAEELFEYILYLESKIESVKDAGFMYIAGLNQKVSDESK